MNSTEFERFIFQMYVGCMTILVSVVVLGALSTLF